MHTPALREGRRATAPYCHTGEPQTLPNSRFCKALPQARHAAPGWVRSSTGRDPDQGQRWSARRAAEDRQGQEGCLPELPRRALLQQLPPPGLEPDKSMGQAPPEVVKKNGAAAVLRLPPGDVLLALPREPQQVAVRRSVRRGARPAGRAPPAEPGRLRLAGLRRFLRHLNVSHSMPRPVDLGGRTTKAGLCASVGMDV